MDPLDGTKEFIKKNGEFTVNIALVEDGEPVLGVVLQPVTGVLYAAQGRLQAALTALQAALRNDPHHLAARENLGSALAANGTEGSCTLTQTDGSATATFTGIGAGI